MTEQEADDFLWKFQNQKIRYTKWNDKDRYFIPLHKDKSPFGDYNICGEDHFPDGGSYFVGIHKLDGWELVELPNSGVLKQMEELFNGNEPDNSMWKTEYFGMDFTKPECDHKDKYINHAGGTKFWYCRKCKKDLGNV